MYVKEAMYEHLLEAVVEEFSAYICLDLAQFVLTKQRADVDSWCASVESPEVLFSDGK